MLRGQVMGVVEGPHQAVPVVRERRSGESGQAASGLITVASPLTLVVTTEASFPASLHGVGGRMGLLSTRATASWGVARNLVNDDGGRHQQRRRDAANGLKPSLTLVGEVGAGWVPTTLAWCWR